MMKLGVVDAFRQPDQHVLSSGSLLGGVLSIFTFFSLLFLFFVELSNLYSEEVTTELIVDPHENGLLRINFDLTFFDIPCQLKKKLIKIYDFQ